MSNRCTKSAIAVIRGDASGTLVVPHGGQNMRTLLFVGLSLIATAFAPFVPVAQAHTCDSSGFGTETVNCSWSCTSGQRAKVDAFVDDNGSIWGRATCSGGAQATCSGTSACGATSAGTASGNAGTCEGEGNGGIWTDLHVQCSSTAFAQTSPGKPDERSRLSPSLSTTWSPASVHRRSLKCSSLRRARAPTSLHLGASSWGSFAMPSSAAFPPPHPA